MTFSLNFIANTIHQRGALTSPIANGLQTKVPERILHATESILGSSTARSIKERAARHRAALRARGLRPKQFWVPDTRTAEFAARAREDCATINSSAGHEDDLRFAEAVQHWPE